MTVLNGWSTHKARATTTIEQTPVSRGSAGAEKGLIDAEAGREN